MSRKMKIKTRLYSLHYESITKNQYKQIYGLVLDQIPEFKSKVSSHKRIINSIKRRYKNDVKKQREKIEKECNKHVKALLFQQSLRMAKNKKNNQQTLFSSWNM